MPRDKDLKRLVRARMHKTGEAYTTARAHITRKPKKQASRRKAAALSIDYAALAGMSNDVIKEKTGCTWERWVAALDHHGAAQMKHRDIAKLVSEKYKVADWWCQTVTVGYERIKGLRAIGQRTDGTYEATKSRTFDVPVKVLFDAWADEAVRRRWLEENVKVRTATSPKSMRMDWPDGTLLIAGFTAKGEHRSAVAIAHTKLPDRQTADRLKQFWTERLDAFGKILV